MIEESEESEIAKINEEIDILFDITRTLPPPYRDASTISRTKKYHREWMRDFRARKGVKMAHSTPSNRYMDSGPNTVRPVLCKANRHERLNLDMERTIHRNVLFNPAPGPELYNPQPYRWEIGMSSPWTLFHATCLDCDLEIHILAKDAPTWLKRYIEKAIKYLDVTTRVMP